MLMENSNRGIWPGLAQKTKKKYAKKMHKKRYEVNLILGRVVYITITLNSRHKIKMK